MSNMNAEPMEKASMEEKAILRCLRIRGGMVALSWRQNWVTMNTTIRTKAVTKRPIIRADPHL